jgi:hypothetical protein
LVLNGDACLVVGEHSSLMKAAPLGAAFIASVEEICLS